MAYEPQISLHGLPNWHVFHVGATALTNDPRSRRRYTVQVQLADIGCFSMDNKPGYHAGNVLLCL